MTTKEALETLEFLNGVLKDYAVAMSHERYTKVNSAYADLREFLEDLDKLEEDSRKFNEEVDNYFNECWEEDLYEDDILGIGA